ncbi:DUF4124 domain-containing protein [Quisquiliibacterium transsilvanicum]|uniref:DUF4124 domain-containing protein n=1 Tax=Quisquiliibacterium transsilvanicum TaxID=1549638 RepID=A0A7W8HJ46_9BURK|nr:DUF4124 domain-containing protein [Quisquiliibacterium transsilvanicum]MBB5272361.1 hypothetical protein [Quisquiliibacterium transsilvanicum]
MTRIAFQAPRLSPTFVLLAATAVLAIAVPARAGSESTPALRASQPAPGALAPDGRGLAVQVSASRVYRSVGPDGRVVFGDQPEPGAKSVLARSFAPSSDPQAIETARRRQAYWRAQAEAFSARQKDRELAESRARSEAQAAAGSAPIVLIVPRNLRAPDWAVPVHMPAGGFPATYPSSPGAAAQVPAAFIGSGFATGR